MLCSLHSHILLFSIIFSIFILIIPFWCDSNGLPIKILMFQPTATKNTAAGNRDREEKHDKMLTLVVAFYVFFPSSFPLFFCVHCFPSYIFASVGYGMCARSFGLVLVYCCFVKVLCCFLLFVVLILSIPVNCYGCFASVPHTTRIGPSPSQSVDSEKCP